MSESACPTQLIDRLQRTVAPGRATLTPAEQDSLREVTARLVGALGPQAHAELATFRSIVDRRITVNDEAVDRVLTGAVVLVTGGTGTIGSALLRRLAEFRPARVVSISRGVTAPVRVCPGVEYRTVDIRDLRALSTLAREIRPTVIFHLAAQHDPSLAEVDVAGTLSTNVGGTTNVLAVCRELPGVRLVHASTGKALRPFSPDVYAGSKKMAEWLLGRHTSAHHLLTSAVRFTHVVDNSIIARRLARWTARDEPIRLHGADTMFYVQSAREAADLLTSALVGGRPGVATVHTIRDLGWPVALLDLSLGWIADTGSRAPVYICGYEAGYESSPYPGLYDPRVSVERSPLVNALEAFSTVDASGSVDVDSYDVPAPTDLRPLVEIDALAAEATAAVATAGQTGAVDARTTARLRRQVESVGWTMLTGSLGSLPDGPLRRHLDLLAGLPEAQFGADNGTVRRLVLREATRRGFAGPTMDTVAS